MAKTEISSAPPNVVERNIALLGNLMSYLLSNPALFNSLPDNFEMVILPDDDPEMRLYNLELLDTYGSEGKPVVFVRMPSGKSIDFSKTRPNLYIPVAA